MPYNNKKDYLRISLIPILEHAGVALTMEILRIHGETRCCGETFEDWKLSESLANEACQKCVFRAGFIGLEAINNEVVNCRV